MAAPDGQARATIETVLLDLPDRPVATTRGRGWDGVTLDLHAAAQGVHLVTRPRDHHVLFFCHTGAGRLLQRRDGQQHEGVLRAGSAVLMPAGRAGSWEGDAPATARLRLPLALISEAAQGATVELRDVFEMRDSFIEQLARLLMAELDRPTHPAQALIAGAASCALAAHLLRSCDLHGKRPSPPSGALSERVMGRINDYIAQRLDSPISLDDLARVAKVSRFHFTRQFKRSAGVSPMVHLERMRIQRAQEMIRDATLPLADIALAAGFADQSHFTRRFRLHAGCTPMEFARMHGVGTLPKRG